VLPINIATAKKGQKGNSRAGNKEERGLKKFKMGKNMCGKWENMVIV